MKSPTGLLSNGAVQKSPVHNGLVFVYYINNPSLTRRIKTSVKDSPGHRSFSICSMIWMGNRNVLDWVWWCFFGRPTGFFVRESTGIPSSLALARPWVLMAFLISLFFMLFSSIGFVWFGLWKWYHSPHHDWFNQFVHASKIIQCCLGILIGHNLYFSAVILYYVSFHCWFLCCYCFRVLSHPKGKLFIFGFGQ